jgi:hypothetical protein
MMRDSMHSPSIKSDTFMLETFGGKLTRTRLPDFLAIEFSKCPQPSSYKTSLRLYMY